MPLEQDDIVDHQVIMVCDHCGADCVSVGATLVWNVPTQQWVVEDVNDNVGWCGACGRDRTLHQVNSYLKE